VAVLTRRRPFSNRSLFAIILVRFHCHHLLWLTRRNFGYLETMEIMNLRSLFAMALFCAPATAAAFPLSPESQAVFDAKVKPFLQANCVRCHGEKKTLAGFRADTLGTDFLAGKTGDAWKEIYDRIGNRSMPPKKEPRPDPDSAFAVTEWIAQELRNAEKRAKGMAGRIPTRRLNRTEYANTLRDLFDLDENFVRALEHDLPMDGKVDGFDRGGAGLFIYESQLVKYLETADLVLSKGVFAPKPAQITSGRCAPRDRIDWHTKKYQGRYADLPTYPAGHPLRDNEREYVTVPQGANFAKLTRGGLEFVGTGYHGDGSLHFYGGTWLYWNGPWMWGEWADGWYRLRCRAGAFKGTGKYALDEVKLSLRYSPGTPIGAQSSVTIDAPLEEPREYELLIFLRRGSDDIPRSLNLVWNGGPKELVINSPAHQKIERDWNHVYFSNADLFARQPPAPAEEIAAAKKRAEEATLKYHLSMLELDVFTVFHPDVDLAAIPRLWLEWVELDGPVDPWPPKARTELFFDGEARSVDSQYVREIFARLLPRAYRRPVADAELERVVNWVLKTQEANSLTGIDAVREGIKMVLCSPSFLLLQESAGEQDQPRQLTDYELASRLSYFFWSTMPDAELIRLAAVNTLHEPATLEAQVRRMLADPKATSLVENFTGQWLKVRDFPSVVTDRSQYKLYDDELRDSSRREPSAFFREILANNLSILNFVDSDFVVVDGRLAAHYGIDGVKGSEFRPVKIGPEQRRGGVLGMAGILTYLTDGLRTLPVRRATYVLDALWNSPPPPPPPNVGDLPPVGAVKTVRERLELHRQSDSCASCHSRIDPFGMALENYDAIGAWRDRQNGERFNNDPNAPLLGVSGALPSGREFKNVSEFKEALLAEKDRFVRGFVEKMLTYALGRPVGATDRSTVDEIIHVIAPATDAGHDQYRLQDLLQAIVRSQAFQTK
jgi:mono/diheme cytochrome c family protein